jgi:hypothetical protein
MDRTPSQVEKDGFIPIYRFEGSKPYVRVGKAEKPLLRSDEDSSSSPDPA